MNSKSIFTKTASLTFSLLFFIFSNAQTGTISGKVFNQKNESIVGASVILMNTAGGTSTGTDGSFQLNLDAGRNYTLMISSIGYNTKEISNVELFANKTTNIHIFLEESSQNKLEAVVIKSSARKETINALIQYQKNTSAVAQVVSAEAISKSPDRNTGDVLKRVSGISLQDGKYLVVRGLADRYNQTMVNGYLMSSTEADRKTFSYDIFPSSVIENIIVNKTAIPELPAEFSGGLVQLTTKDIPSKNFLSISAGTGINTQTTGKPFYTYQGGKFDWLGIDDGTRALPNAFPIVRGKFIPLDDRDKYALSKLFSNNWSVNNTTGLPNASFQLNGGFVNRGNGSKKLGAIYSLTYNKSNRTINQIRKFQDDAGQIIQQFDDHKYNQEVLIGAIGNISYQLNSNNKFSWKNTFSINSSDNTLLRNGINPDAGNETRSQEMSFKSNMYYTTQFGADHFIRKSDIKINWTGSFTSLYQSTPDLRRLSYVKPIGSSDTEFIAAIQNGLPSLASGTRFYSDLMDYIYGGAGSVSKSFNWLNQKQTFKTGYMYQYKDRGFASRPVGVTQYGADASLLKLPTNLIFAPANFESGKFKYDEINNRNFDYLATGQLHAAFVQMDNSFSDKFRAVWGLRMEGFQQRLSGSNSSNQPVTIHTKITDFLPSVNLTYKKTNSTNIRFGASQTLVRPEFRELSPFEFYDFELVASVKGNENLKRTKVTNLDLRYEIYPRAGELITVGGFFKHFSNPIEPFLFQSGPATFTVNYNNAPDAVAYGIEFDFRKKMDFVDLLKNFTLNGNLAFINNEVNMKKIDPNTKLDNRPMQGQSPYVMNFGLQYDHEKSNTTLSLVFNQVGRRIYFVGSEEFPDVYEAPRPLFDLQINHQILKGKGELKLSANDLLNAKADFYQDVDKNGRFNSNKDFLFRRYNSGTNISLSFSYKFKK